MGDLAGGSVDGLLVLGPSERGMRRQLQVRTRRLVGHAFFANTDRTKRWVSIQLRMSPNVLSGVTQSLGIATNDRAA